MSVDLPALGFPISETNPQRNSSVTALPSNSVRLKFKWRPGYMSRVSNSRPEAIGQTDYRAEILADKRVRQNAPRNTLRTNLALYSTN